MNFVVSRVGPDLTYFNLYDEEKRYIGSCKGDTGTTYSRRGEPYLLCFGVEERFRGKGFGQRILSAIIEHYKKLGADRLTLEVVRDNDRAIRVYEKLGFEYMLKSKGPVSRFTYYMVRYL